MKKTYILQPLPMIPGVLVAGNLRHVGMNCRYPGLQDASAAISCADLYTSYANRDGNHSYQKQSDELIKTAKKF